MHRNRCPARCHRRHNLSRRAFLGSSALLVGSSGLGRSSVFAAEGPEPVSLSGPGSKYIPTIKAAFVRRENPSFGMAWPGEVYDPQTAQKIFTEKIRENAARLGMKVDVRPEPIFSSGEADRWLDEAKDSKPDGLFVLLLDRQQHSWPTAERAVDTGIPTLIYSPVGTSMTPNTRTLSKRAGCVIYSTDDFSQPALGMKMLWAGAKMRAARYIVLCGNKEFDTTLSDLGLPLRYVPPKAFVDLYQSMPETDQMHAMADDYMKRAVEVRDVKQQDVLNGARCYFVARKILDQFEGDAITMDCLHALRSTSLSLPCLAWSRLNDERVPAMCEADLGAVATSLIVHYLLDRPGFQQDPVGETAHKAIIGAHCSCPTRLAGFDQPPEPFVLRHHHANRDSTTQTLWREGQEVTSVDVLVAGRDETVPRDPHQADPSQPSRLLLSTGRVLGNVAVPPAGGCVTSVMVKFDGVDDVLAYPGFHQLFVYGNHKDALVDFGRLQKIEPQII